MAPRRPHPRHASASRRLAVPPFTGPSSPRRSHRGPISRLCHLKNTTARRRARGVDDADVAARARHGGGLNGGLGPIGGGVRADAHTHAKSPARSYADAGKRRATGWPRGRRRGTGRACSRRRRAPLSPPDAQDRVEFDGVGRHPTLPVLKVEETDARDMHSDSDTLEGGRRRVERRRERGAHRPDVRQERTRRAHAFRRGELGDHGSAAGVGELEVIVAIVLLLVPHQARRATTPWSPRAGHDCSAVAGPGPVTRAGARCSWGPPSVGRRGARQGPGTRHFLRESSR